VLRQATAHLLRLDRLVVGANREAGAGRSGSGCIRRAPAHLAPRCQRRNADYINLLDEPETSRTFTGTLVELPDIGIVKRKYDLVD